ncbi:MAG: hypothetical protein P9L94_10965 [Candidatus Hinthialibacter antarcticus]|nr:hypothetical protein [Candidatus Hinthialibacter antarcticus]
MQDRVNLTFIFSLLIFFALTTSLASAQDMPSLPPLSGEDSGDDGVKSFMNMLRGDLMRRLEDAKQSTNSLSRGVQRPKPELGKHAPSNQAIDISKYLGADGDPAKTIEKLIESGKIPPSAASSIPQHSSAASQHWKSVPLGKRIEYAEDLVRRRKPNAALDELGEILNEKELGEDEKIGALILREKALLLLRKYQTVQEDYYRLKTYYPERSEVEDLRSYMEEQTGLDTLQERVKKAPDDEEAQQDLLKHYVKMGWLDFAEEFFGATLKDSSAPTIKSLSEIYYRKKDNEMLITLSRVAQELHPKTADFYYNEGVALYAQGDRKSARASFQKALGCSRNPVLNTKINWYLQRLSAR